MKTYKELWVALIVAVVSLGVLLVFIGGGWPGDVNSCVAANDCYCESFNIEDIGKPGVRQPANTWSNFVPVLFGLFIALFVGIDRSNGRLIGPNRMKRETFYPMLYSSIVVFMGPGSMFFHASMIQWAGVVDMFSMFIFVAFIVTYGITRVTDQDWVFYVFFPLVTVALTVISIFWENSFVLIAILAVPYGIFELVLVIGNFVKSQRLYYVFALVSFGAAYVIWELSKTGRSLCFPEFWLQGHAIWHILASVMATLLFFYYRSSEK